MRSSLTISVAAHFVLIVGASVAFPSARPFEVEPMKTVPVDIVPASELTRLKAGTRAAEPREPETARPEPPQKTAALPAPAPAPPEEPKVAAPVPPAPRPQPRAEERDREPAPKAPEPKPAEPERQAEQAAPVPVPPPRPAHMPRPAPRKEAEFNPDRIAALLDKSPQRSAAPDQAAADAPRAGEGDPRGLDERMSLSEIDALRAQISRCWSPPVGTFGAADLTVQLQLSLNPDGTLTRPPEVLTRGSGMAFTAAVDSARRAVLRCQPYDLPVSKYNAWRDIRVNFDPREMLGG